MALTHGIVAGKFLPPHSGHIYVAQFAWAWVDKLTIVVQSTSADPIAASTRQQWLRELFPTAEVIVVECDGYVRSAASVSRAFSGIKVDCVFGSQPHHQQIASLLGANCIPVDPQHTQFPIRSEEVLSNPFGYWQFLPWCVRAHFVRRVCIFGPHSTGKSTLAADLAREFESLAVPEYGRIYGDSRDNHFEVADRELICRGHIASEEALARQANKILFCDTDPIITLMWSDWLSKRVPEFVREQSAKKRYDLYLLTDVDVPPANYAEAQQSFERCRQELDQRELPYVILSGSWEERFGKAVSAVQSLMAPKTPVEA